MQVSCCSRSYKIVATVATIIVLKQIADLNQFCYHRRIFRSLE
jgi:hypothetical protein